VTEIPVLPLLGTANTCDNCLFWDPQDEERMEGYCRAHAPRAPEQLGGRAIWPLCRPGDWCGEWEATA